MVFKEKTLKNVVGQRIFSILHMKVLLSLLKKMNRKSSLDRRAIYISLFDKRCKIRWLSAI